MPPPCGEECLDVAAGVEHCEQPDLRWTDDVEKAVWKAVKIQAAHPGKADGIQLRVINEVAVVRKKICGKFPPQTRLLLLIPIVSVPQVSAYEGMSYERGHRRIRGTSFWRQLRRMRPAWRDRFPFRRDAGGPRIPVRGPAQRAARFHRGVRPASA